jgi:hypothetical protein
MSHHRAQSILGKYAPNVLIGKDEIFVVMKVFLDGGGDGGRDPDRVILSGIAANDEVWKEIELNWLGILQLGDPKAAYMHMNEALFLKREFAADKGWDDTKVDGLVNSLLSYLTSVPKESYCQFACTVEMDAYRKLQAETYQIDSPAKLCTDSCMDRIMDWYLLEYRGGVDLEAHYYFDFDEPFEEIFKAQRKREVEAAERRGQHSRWQHVTHVGPVAMRSTVGIQVADMLAWSTNRQAASPGQRFCDLIIALKALMPTKWAIWDEALLRKYYRPLIYKPYGNEQI